MAEYQYKVVAIPRDVAVMKKLFSATDPGATVAGYVEGVINQYAQEGWEFYRADEISVTERPGCLSLFGQGETVTRYNLLVFRKPKG